MMPVVLGVERGNEKGRSTEYLTIIFGGHEFRYGPKIHKSVSNVGIPHHGY
jgi:hypothetical protein